MKRGLKALFVYLSYILLLILVIQNSIKAEGKVSALAQKTRAMIKSWVYKGWVQRDNFFEVEPEKMYRSSQLLPSRLEWYIKRYGIKTIINLSGEEPYYWVAFNEKQLADKYKIALFNIKTHALTVTSFDKVRSLLAIFLSAPLPILVHCFAGFDRTGEACALYHLATDKGVKEALFQLSPQFGHRKWLFPFKYHLIMNINKLYPNLLSTMKQICDQRFSYEELKNIKPEELYFKILEKKVEQDR
ncbi:hypothetical protein E3J79_02265 [Candidatus Dependentiae bacterium]|nr:MAG: hypothetical protein E3J79_02265 [Candidatus Dependentiae bacterium]